MNNEQKLNTNLETIAWNALLIDKVHSCADCPIRLKAIAEPQSVFARIHNWHKTWWPGWKAQQARTCPLTGKVVTHV